MLLQLIAVANKNQIALNNNKMNFSFFLACVCVFNGLFKKFRHCKCYSDKSGQNNRYFPVILA